MKKLLLSLVGFVCSLVAMAVDVNDLTSITQDCYFVFETITGTTSSGSGATPTASTLYFDSQLLTKNGTFNVANNKGKSTFGDGKEHYNCLRLKNTTDWVAIKLSYPATITTYGDNASRGLQVGTTAGGDQYGKKTGNVLNFEVTSAGTIYINGSGSDYFVAGFTVSLYQPIINTNPVSATYGPGAVATPLSVTATAKNGGALSYQWYSNSSESTVGAQAIEGATNSTYTPSTTNNGALYYYCVVSEAGLGKTTQSGYACVTVAAEEVPSISLTASPTSIVFGETSTITANIVSNPAYTSIVWYKAAGNEPNPSTDEQVATSGTSYEVSGINETSKYYAVVTNSIGSTTSDLCTITYVKNTVAQLTNLVLDNGCNTAIVDGTKTITGYYMQGAAVPGVKSITISNGATYNIDGTTLTVTAEDGTTTQDYTYTLTAVEPLTSLDEQDAFTTTPSWLKMGVRNSGKSSHEIYKSVDQSGNMRITEGMNRAYLFVGPCDAVILTNSSSSENTDREGYYSVNGGAPVNVTWPKYNNGAVSVTIPCSASGNNIIEIVNTSTSGSWGFDKVQLLTKSYYDLKSVLFSGVAKSGVELEVVHKADETEVTSTYADITGGEMYAYDGHATSDAAMVILGQFNLNASGNSYVHVKLDNALKAGDVIYTENGDNLLVANFYVSKTSSKGSNIYQFPYEVKAGSDLENAEDLYIFKNTGSVFSGIKVVGDKLSATVNISSVGYATFYDSEHAVKVPAGVTAYVYGMGDEGLGLVALEDEMTFEGLTYENIIPAGVAVVLEGSGEVVLNYTTSTVLPEDLLNYLLGSDVATETQAPEGLEASECNFYGLSLDKNNNPQSVGFYWMVEGGLPFMNGAHKAYLAIPKFLSGADYSSKKALPFKPVATGIKTVNTSVDGNGVAYNIVGQRVANNVKGLVIVNGKKLINK